MRIVTGYTGSPHITSNDDQSLNQGIFGRSNCVLNVGSVFNATLTSATQLTIDDGEGIMQGVHFRIDPGETEVLTIASGTADYLRYDLVVARYTKDAGTGIEKVELAVKTGTPDESSPTIPSLSTGNIRTGTTLCEMPLYLIYVYGLTPSIDKVLFPIEKSFFDPIPWGDYISFTNKTTVSETYAVNTSTRKYSGMCFVSGWIDLSISSSLSYELLVEASVAEETGQLNYYQYNGCAKGTAIFGEHIDHNIIPICGVMEVSKLTVQLDFARSVSGSALIYLHVVKL